jgi:CXXC-20-CXXC protein
MKPFCCHQCNTKFKFNKALLLSENSIIKCPNCGALNYPVGLTNAYFKFGFIATFVPGIVVSFYYRNLPLGLTIALLFGIIGYLISVIHTYKKTFFSQTK